MAKVLQPLQLLPLRHLHRIGDKERHEEIAKITKFELDKKETRGEQMSGYPWEIDLRSHECGVTYFIHYHLLGLLRAIQHSPQQSRSFLHLILLPRQNAGESTEISAAIEVLRVHLLRGAGDNAGVNVRIDDGR